MDFDYRILHETIELSKKCSMSDGSFSVGAIIISPDKKIISTGFTRELGQRMHAEEVALKKAGFSEKDLVGATLYSSLEPCGERLSGKKPCSLRIIKAGIKKVVFALREPQIFVKPKGMKILFENDIQVKVIEELAPLVETINKHLK